METALNKVNHHIKKLATNQEKMILKLQKLDKVVRVMLNSHLTVNETVSKVAEDVELLEKRKNENALAIKSIDRQIVEVIAEIEKILNNQSEKRYEKATEKSDATEAEGDVSLACSICDLTFIKRCDLENHLIGTHNQQKDLKCDICGKEFILNWRLKKHQQIHTSSSVKPCRYFISDKACPFEEIGCKFLHVVSDKLKVNKKFRNIPDEKQMQSNCTELRSTATCKKSSLCEKCDDSSKCSECVVRDWNSKW